MTRSLDHADIGSGLQPSQEGGAAGNQPEPGPRQRAPVLNQFFLRTRRTHYRADSDEVEALEALGFDFRPTHDSRCLWKHANPPAPYIIQDLAHLINFIGKHGPVTITQGHELIIEDGHA